MISEGKKKHDDDDVRAIGRAELLAMVRLACVEGRTLAQTKKEAQSAEDEDADADAAESEDLLLAAVCSSTLSNRREIYPLYQSGYSVFPSLKGTSTWRQKSTLTSSKTKGAQAESVHQLHSCLPQEDLRATFPRETALANQWRESPDYFHPFMSIYWKRDSNSFVSSQPSV